MALSPFHASTTNDLRAPDETSVTRIGKSRPRRRVQVPSAGVYLGWLPGIAINASSAVKRVTPVRKIADHGHFDISVGPGRPPGWPTE